MFIYKDTNSKMQIIIFVQRYNISLNIITQYKLGIIYKKILRAVQKVKCNKILHVFLNIMKNTYFHF